MNVSKRVPPKGGFFHGWYILAASFIILFLTSGARYSFGVAFKPMIKEFDWSRGSMSLAFFLNMTLFAVSLIAAGRLYDRYGSKWVILISTVFLSAGFALISLVNSLWQFYIVYGVFAAMGLGGTSIPLLAALISKWFTQWRGLAISLALAGNCMGQFVLIPVFSLSTLRYGWRISYLSIGLVIWLVNMTLALFVIKESPDHLGLSPTHEKEDKKFSILFGLTYLVTGPLATTLLGRLYGFSHIGLLSGFATTVHHIGGGFWTYLGGFIFDQTGSYRLAFTCSAILAFIAMVCCMLIREKRHIYFRQSST